MNAGVTIKATWLDEVEPDLGYFLLTAFNGTQTSVIEIFDHAESFREFGQALADFPHSNKEVVEFKGGTYSPATQQGTWLLMRGYCYDAGGRSALEIDANHLENLPESFRSWFSIPAEIASLNKLGQLLRQWEPAQQPTIRWEAYVE